MRRQLHESLNRRIEYVDPDRCETSEADLQAAEIDRNWNDVDWLQAELRTTRARIARQATESGEKRTAYNAEVDRLTAALAAAEARGDAFRDRQQVMVDRLIAAYHNGASVEPTDPPVTIDELCAALSKARGWFSDTVKLMGELAAFREALAAQGVATDPKELAADLGNIRDVLLDAQTATRRYRAELVDTEQRMRRVVAGEDHTPLYRRVLRAFGPRTQVLKAFEEAGEYTTALARVLAGEGHKADLLGEIADVMVTGEQMALLCGFSLEDLREEIACKLARLEGLVKAKEKRTDSGTR
jgi:hypothetical protein